MDSVADQAYKAPLNQAMTSTGSSSAPTSASKASMQTRNRPGILTRQASEREDGESVDHQSSAPEDDEIRLSDSGSLPRRFPPTLPSLNTDSRASRGAAHQGLVLSPLSPTSSAGGPLSSESARRSPSLRSYPSGGEASASSSRSHLPIQNNTSIYRRQAGGDVSEDGSFRHPSRQEALSRAKSISSVSSVNSTSSMEAVPFRAAPMGNVRVGYGGYGKRMMDAQGQPQFAGMFNDQSTGSTGSTAAISGTDVDIDRPESSTSTAQQHAHISTKSRLLPKGPTDDWHYRTAPGLGSKMRPFPTGSTSAVDLEERSGERARSSFAGGEAESVNMQDTTPQRIKSSMRSKLVKRAGKLGLKPLTSVSGISPSTSFSNSSTGHPAEINAYRALDPDSTLIGPAGADQITAQAYHDALSSNATAPPLNISRISSEEVKSRNGKAYLVRPAAGSSLLGLVSDDQAMTRTSSVTNAPLVVAKNPPGPPGSRPAPSPGLMGPTVPLGGLAGPVASSSKSGASIPFSVETMDGLRGSAGPSNETMPYNSINTGRIPQARPFSQRVDSRSSLNGLLGNLLSSNDGNQRNSLPAISRHTNSTFAPAAAPGITPAQQIRMDVQAGIATVPAEPSGSTPGPNPAMVTEQGMYLHQAQDSELDDAELAESRLYIATRPHAASLSTQRTAKPSKTTALRSSAAIGTQAQAQSGSQRPGLRRAQTSESANNSDPSRSNTRGAGVDESSGVSDYWSGRPYRSANVSPQSATPPPIPSASPVRASSSSEYSPSLRLDIPPDGLPTAIQPDGGTSNSAIPVSDTTLAPVKPVTTPTPGSDLLTSEMSPLPGHSPSRNAKALPSIKEAQPSSEDNAAAADVAMPNPLRPTLASMPSAAISTSSSESPPVSIKHPEQSKASLDVAPSHARKVAELNTAAHGSKLEAAKPSNASSSSLQQPTSRPRGSSHSRSIRVESDFHFGDILGEGSYSTVLKAWDMKPLRERFGVQKNEVRALDAIMGKGSTGSSARRSVNVEGAKVYAVKVLDKVHILKEKKQKYVNIEKEALSLLLRHPGVITLYWTFQDMDSLYFVLELATNGELLSFIKRLGSFDADCTRYYGAQLVETIQAIHEAGILHRDLKPENVLLDSQMRIKITDFGSARFCKSVPNDKTTGSSSEQKDNRRSSFVGTAEYVSPELLTEKQVTEASDWWAFGCLLYQMLCGRPPFKGASEYQTFQKIMKRDFEFPVELGEQAKSLIDGIMILIPESRLTAAGIRSHAFFAGIVWEEIWTRDAPELRSGIYKAPEKKATASTTTFLSTDDDAPQKRSSATTSLSEDRDVSESGREDDMQQSMIGSLTLGQEGSAEVTQDADDDDSSFSDTNNAGPSGIASKRRGLSAGASAAERMLSVGNNGGRRAGNFLRMAAGLTTLPHEADASSSSRSNQQIHQWNTRRGSKMDEARLAGGVSNSNVDLQGARQEHATAAASAAALAGPRRDSQAQQLSSSSSILHTSLAASWASLLLPNESLLYSCPIIHKTAAALLRSGTKRRHLLLTDFPRLLCIKETNDQLKVKSEVIIALPVSPTKPQSGHYPEQNIARAQDTEIDDEDGGPAHLDAANNKHNSSGGTPSLHNAAPMQRQSSAGPLLTSQLRYSAPVQLLAGQGTGLAEQSRQYIQRRESFPVSSLQRPASSGSSDMSDAGVQDEAHTSSLSSRKQSSSPPVSPFSPNYRHTNPSTTISEKATYADPSPNVMTSIEQKNIRTFLVTTPAQSFLYEDPTGDATHWIRSITAAARLPMDRR